MKHFMLMIVVLHYFSHHFQSIFMAEAEDLLKKLPPEGVMGLTMMAAPVVGLPLVFHAVTGAVIGGIGFAAVTTLMSPFIGKMLTAAGQAKFQPSPAPKEVSEDASGSVPDQTPPLAEKPDDNPES